MNIERTRQFRMNLSEEELAMLRELADVEGLSASDYLRRHIRQQYKAERSLARAFAGSWSKAEQDTGLFVNEQTKRRVRRRLQQPKKK